MKIKRVELANALALACKLAQKPTKHSNSNFESVRLSTLNSNDKLTITACGHDTFITIDVPHIDAYTIGKLDCLIPAHDLLAIVKPATKKDTSLISFERTDGISGIDVVTNTDRFNFPFVPGENFPSTPNYADKPIVAYYAPKVLQSALDFCLPAVSRDDPKLHINCICLVDRNMVATDGHRLHVYNLPIKMPNERTIDELSAKTLHAVCRFLDPATTVDCYSPENGATLADNWIHFVTKNVVLAARIGTVAFPSYEQVIPAAIPGYAVRTAELHDAVKSVPVPTGKSNDKASGIILEANSAITVKVDAHDRHFALAVNPVYAPDKKLTRIGVYPRYLLEALATEDETVTVQIDGPLDPIVIRHGIANVAVVMPMRI